MNLDWLDNVFAKPINSPVSQREQSVKYSKELEAAAKSRGFKTAEEMVLWENQRSQKRAPQTIKGQGAKPPAKEGPKNQPRNLRGILDYVSDALGGGRK